MAIKKEDVLAILQAQLQSELDQASQAIQAKYAGLNDAVNAIADVPVDGGDQSAQIADLQKQLADLQAAKAQEDADLADAISKLSADEDKLAKLKAFVNELVGA